MNDGFLETGVNDGLIVGICEVGSIVGSVVG